MAADSAQSLAAHVVRPSGGRTANIIYSTSASAAQRFSMDIHPLCECTTNMLLDLPTSLRPDTMSVTYGVESSSGSPVPKDMVARFAQLIIDRVQLQQVDPTCSEATFPAVWVHMDSETNISWFRAAGLAVVQASRGAVMITTEQQKPSCGFFFIMRQAIGSPGNAIAAMLLINVRDTRVAAVRIARRMLLSVPQKRTEPLPAIVVAEAQPMEEATGAAAVAHVVGAYFSRGFFCIDVRLAESRRLASFAVAAPASFSFTILMCTPAGVSFTVTEQAAALQQVRTAALAVRLGGAAVDITARSIPGGVQPTWGYGRIPALRVLTPTPGCAVAVRILLYGTPLADCPLADWLPHVPAVSKAVCDEYPSELYTVGARVSVAAGCSQRQVLAREALSQAVVPDPDTAGAAGGDHTAVCLSFDARLEDARGWKWACLAVVNTAGKRLRSYALYTPAAETFITTKASIAADAEEYAKIHAQVKQGGSWAAAAEEDVVFCEPNILSRLRDLLYEIDPDSVVFHGNKKAADSFLRLACKEAQRAEQSWVPGRDWWLTPLVAALPVEEPSQYNLQSLGIGYLPAVTADCEARLMEAAPEAMHLFHSDSELEQAQEFWGPFLPGMLLGRVQAVQRLLGAWTLAALGRTELLRIPTTLAAACGTEDLAAWRVISESRRQRPDRKAPWVAWVHPHETTGVRPASITYTPRPTTTTRHFASVAGKRPAEQQQPQQQLGLGDFNSGEAPRKKRRVALQSIDQLLSNTTDSNSGVARGDSRSSWSSQQTTTTATDASLSSSYSADAATLATAGAARLFQETPGEHSVADSLFSATQAAAAAPTTTAPHGAGQPPRSLLTAGTWTLNNIIVLPSWFRIRVDPTAAIKAHASIGSVAACKGVLRDEIHTTRVGGRKRRDTYRPLMKEQLETCGFISAVDIDLSNAYPHAFVRNNMGPTTSSLLLPPETAAQRAGHRAPIELTLFDNSTAQLWSCAADEQPSLLSLALQDVMQRKKEALQKAEAHPPGSSEARRFAALAAQAKQVMVSMHGTMRIDWAKRLQTQQTQGFMAQRSSLAGMSCYISNPIGQVISDAAVLDVSNRVTQMLSMYELETQGVLPKGPLSSELSMRGVLGVSLVVEITDGVLIGVTMRSDARRQPTAAGGDNGGEAVPAGIQDVAAAIASRLATMDVGEHVVQAVPCYCEDERGTRVISLSTPVQAAFPPLSVGGAAAAATESWRVKIRPRAQKSDWPFLAWVLKALHHVRPIGHVAGQPLTALEKWRAMRDFVLRAHAEVLRGNVLITELETLMDGAHKIMTATYSIDGKARQAAAPVMPYYGYEEEEQEEAHEQEQEPEQDVATLVMENQMRMHNSGPWLQAPQAPVNFIREQGTRRYGGGGGAQPQKKGFDGTAVGIRELVNAGLRADHKTYARRLLDRFPPLFVGRGEQNGGKDSSESSGAAALRSYIAGIGGSPSTAIMPNNPLATKSGVTPSRVALAARMREMHRWAAPFLDETHTCVTGCDEFGSRSCAVCGVLPDSFRGQQNSMHIVTSSADGES